MIPGTPRSGPEFALDTNALIHALKGLGDVRQRLLSTDPENVAIPSVVLYELEYGTLRAASAGRRRDITRLASTIAVLPFDSRAAERSAHVRLALEKKGRTIGPVDLMIAGTALAFGCALVTHNLVEFKRVPGLRVEDWY